MPLADHIALRLAAVIDSSSDAILSHDLNGIVDTWNPAAARLFGYPADEMIGQPIERIVPDDLRASDSALVARVRQGEAIMPVETRALTKDGAVIAIAWSISPVFVPAGTLSGIARIARDVTSAQGDNSDGLRLAALVNSSEDAIISKDLNGIVQSWNKAAERMFGYTAEEMIGQSIKRIIPSDRLSEEDSVLARVREGLPVEHFETIRQHKNGSLLEISLSVSPIRTPSGAIIGASKIARDITVQRLLTHQAEEANRVKDEFLATLSHELRTPLNAVLGYTRMLRTGNLGADRQERAIDVIERNAALLHQLVSDVLDVSGIVTGKMRMNQAPCDLSAIVEAACESVQPTSEAKGIPISIERPPEPVMVRCDTDRMQQVFWNLMANAVKFTPSGGRVSVKIDTVDQLARATVSDTGVGIRREMLPNVFQRFWQGDSVNSRQTGGLGLGLALARHFVELHGGTIVAESPGQGQGAKFTVTLPLQATR